MAAQKLSHYNLRAPRELLDRLRDFYCATVGLRLGARPAFRSHGYWLYAGDRDVLHLSQAREGEVREVGATTTFDHIAFACDDFDAMRAVLVAAGVPFEIDDVPGSGVRQIFFRDPAGNGIELNFDARTLHGS